MKGLVEDICFSGLAVCTGIYLFAYVKIQTCNSMTENEMGNRVGWGCWMGGRRRYYSILVVMSDSTLYTKVFPQFL